MADMPHNTPAQIDDALLMLASIIGDAAVMHRIARKAATMPSLESVRALYHAVQVLAMVVRRQPGADQPVN